MPALQRILLKLTLVLNDGITFFNWLCDKNTFSMNR